MRNAAQSFQMAQRLVLIADVLLSNKQKQRHKICRSHNKTILIKLFRNCFGRANFTKSFVAANLIWHNVSMKLVHYGGRLLPYGGNALQKKFATFSGRATRREFFSFVSFGIGNPFFILSLYIIIGFIPFLAVSVRRLHDINRSGWWVLIPIVEIFFLCKKSDEGVNDYGEPSNFI